MRANMQPYQLSKKDQTFAIAIIHVTVRTIMDMVSRLPKIIETHGIKVKLFLHTRSTGRSNAYSVP